MIFLLIQDGSPASINVVSLGFVSFVKITHDIRNGISQDINLFIWVTTFKSFFPVKIINDFLNKIYKCLLIMLNASYIRGRIKIFRIKFAVHYLAVTVSMQRRVYAWIRWTVWLACEDQINTWSMATWGMGWLLQNLFYIVLGCHLLKFNFFCYRPILGSSFIMSQNEVSNNDC